MNPNTAIRITNHTKQYGTGFVRIRKILENYPEISMNMEQINDFFKITLKTDLKTDPKTDPKNHIEKLIIELIKHNKNITINDISDRIGKGITVTKQYVKNLKQGNKLKRIGSNKGGYWHVIE